MIIIKRRKEIMKTHDLPRLSKIGEITLSEEQKTFLNELNTFYLRPRYPDVLYPSLPNPDKKSTEIYLEKTDKLFFMASKTIEFPKKIVNHYIANLKNKMDVKGVLLFGSFACGKPTKDSDVDLIVVSPDFTKINDRLIWLSNMRDDITYQIAMDIIGYTPREFNNLEKHSTIGAIAKKKGRWIYRAKK